LPVKWIAIKPPRFNARAMTKALQDHMEGWGPETAIPEFDKVTTGWQNERPVWVQKFSVGADWIMNFITPDNPESKGAQKWLWLDEGTPPHPITATKPGGMLVFPMLYQAGSKPNILSTTAGKEFGPLTFTRSVNHPGIEPRNWTDMLVIELTESYYKRAEEGFDLAAAASGHGME